MFFGYRELKILETDFSKYSTGRKRIKYDKSFVTLINLKVFLTQEDILNLIFIKSLIKTGNYTTAVTKRIFPKK